MEAGRNPWLLNSNEELRGLYGCCCRQWCCVNPACSQFLNFDPYKNVRGRSRVTGCASKRRGPCQGEALLFPWSSTHAHLARKKCRQMRGEHFLYPGAVRTPSQVGNEGSLQLLILLGLKWGRVCGAPELCGIHPVAVSVPGAGARSG